MHTLHLKRMSISRFFSSVEQPNSQEKQSTSLSRGYGSYVAAACEFHDVFREIKSVVIQNCLLKRLRTYMLREENLKLDNLLTKARSLEASETQATGMEKNLPTEEVNHFSHKRKQAKTTTKGLPRRPTHASYMTW